MNTVNTTVIEAKGPTMEAFLLAHPFAPSLAKCRKIAREMKNDNPWRRPTAGLI